MSKLLIVLVMFDIAGCSNKAVYDKLRLDERSKCTKEPTTTYFECIERTSKSYEEYEYERERKEISVARKRIDVSGFQKIIKNKMLTKKSRDFFISFRKSKGHFTYSFCAYLQLSIFKNLGRK